MIGSYPATCPLYIARPRYWPSLTDIGRNLGVGLFSLSDWGTRGQYHSDSRREQALCSKDPWRIGQHQLVAWDSFGRPISLYPFNLILVDHVYKLPPVILCTSGLGIPSSSLKSLEWLKSNRIAQLQHTDDRRSFYPIDQKCTMDMPSCLSRQFQQYSGIRSTR